MRIALLTTRNRHRSRSPSATRLRTFDPTAFLTSSVVLHTPTARESHPETYSAVEFSVAVRFLRQLVPAVLSRALFQYYNMGAVKIPCNEPAVSSIPAPGFEGFEKRLEVEFFPATTNESNLLLLGLRALPRAEIDTMLTAAECTIVSQLSNAQFDSYVLSESSLFIYPRRIVLKTCGTTQLLKAIPELLAAASRLGLDQVLRCKYTRGSFMFPDAQPFPHRSFDEEVRILEEHFGELNNSKAFVMGDSCRKWHVYVAAAKLPSGKELEAGSLNGQGCFTLEICMTELDRVVAAKFFKSSSINTGEDMTKESGINLLLPGSQICDFAFDPCGYSMNGMEGGAHSTIHITPEDGFSYASFESMGYDPNSTDLNALVNRVVRCFKPGFLSISVHAAPVAVHEKSEVGGAFLQQFKDTSSTWGSSISVPIGYLCEASSRKELPGGSAAVYHTFRLAATGSPGYFHPVKPLFLNEKQESSAADYLMSYPSIIEDGLAEEKNDKQALDSFAMKIINKAYENNLMTKNEFNAEAEFFPLIGAFERGGFVIVSTRADVLELLKDHLGSRISAKEFDEGEGGDNAKAGILIVANSGKLLTEIAASAKISMLTKEKNGSTVIIPCNHLDSKLHQLMRILDHDKMFALHHGIPVSYTG